MQNCINQNMKLLSIKDKEIAIFTDGSSRGNPGPGGYGVIALYQNSHGEVCVDELGGREDLTTNNRMELKAVIEGLKNFVNYYSNLSEFTCTIYLDSAYVLNGVTKWLAGWKRNGWVTGLKEPVKNQDLWEELDKVQGLLRLKFVHIAGHAGIAGNERCDEIATSFADNVTVNLYTGPITRYDLGSENNILNIEATEEALQKKAKVSKSKSSSKGVKAFSYVSLVDGKIATDKEWKDCEARVKGKSGARFKKATSPMEEKMIIDDFLKKS